MSQRSIAKLIAAQATSDGAGVKLYRSIGSAAQPELDPFLLLDEFFSDDAADYIAGFPDHPHRGFETVTYMLDGTMRHQDNTGNGGSLGPGGVQWMTAGRGIIHSEMPEQISGRMRGFQLWVNLPAALKMCAPRYQNLEPDEIPEVVTDSGIRIRVVAGQSENVTGAVDGISVDPLYLDVALPAGATLLQAIPAGHAAFAYGIEGEAILGGKAMPGRHLAVLGDGDELLIDAGREPARMLLIAARALNEPIVRYGPFVMNNRAEIETAVRDYQAGRF